MFLPFAQIYFHQFPSASKKSCISLCFCNFISLHTPCDHSFFFGFQHIQHRLLIRRSFSLLHLHFHFQQFREIYFLQFFSFSLRSDLHPTDIFHTSLPGNSRDRYFLHTVLSISAQSEAPPDQNHHDNKNYDFPLEKSSRRSVASLGCPFPQIAAQSGYFFTKTENTAGFSKR